MPVDVHTPDEAPPSGGFLIPPHLVPAMEYMMARQETVFYADRQVWTDRLGNVVEADMPRIVNG